MESSDYEAAAKELGTTPEEVESMVEKIIKENGLTLDRVGKLVVGRDPRRDITAPGAFQEHHKLPVDARKARRLRNKARRGRTAARVQASQEAHARTLASTKSARAAQRAAQHGA